MRIRINELRRIIRNVIIESKEDPMYDQTVLPDEEADSDLLAEPDLTDQKDRDEYIASKSKRKKKKARLRSREEKGATGDEHAIVGYTAPLGAGRGGGPGDKPYGKPLRAKNAMGKRPVDEYDE